ncbi:hypothetical protein VPH35_133287 [Triticum aestivum]
MTQQPAILLTLILTMPAMAVAGRALHEAPPAPLLQPSPAATAAPLLQAPPVPYLPPPVPHVPAAAGGSGAVLQQPPAADHPSWPASLHIHVTRAGVLGVVLSFLAGCFLCALFIAFVGRLSKSAQAANGPQGDGGGGGMEDTAQRCLCCFARVAGCA